MNDPIAWEEPSRNKLIDVDQRKAYLNAFSESQLSVYEKIQSFPIYLQTTYNESSFFSGFKKVYDIYYSGSDTRQRKIFLNAAENTNLRVKALYGNRISEQSPNYELYKHELNKSRMTFSNGYITNKNSLIAGRFIESILSRSVCLYEECLDVNAFFQSYLHYVPVTNIHDFVKSAQYLRLNNEVLNTISSESYNYYMNNYSSKLFWNYLSSKIVND